MDITESKIKLKSYCVENGYEIPSYETVSKVKEGVRKFYTVRVSVNGLFTTEGEGVSRRIAEYKAAIKALNELNVSKNEKNEETDNKELDKKENTNENNESDSQVNNESKREINDKSDGQQLVNGKDSKVDEDKDERTVDLDENEPKNESFNIESEDFLKSIKNSVNGTNNEHKDENSVDNLKSDSTSDQNPDNEESINEETDSINKSNSSSKNVSFSKETKDSENNKLETAEKLPKFRPIVKNAVSVLLEFCMKKRSPLPFYDSNYADGSFWLKCKIELDSDEGKQEFIGMGCGDSLKAAKIVAAEDVIQQLKEKNLI